MDLQTSVNEIIGLKCLRNIESRPATGEVLADLEHVSILKFLELLKCS